MVTAASGSVILRQCAKLLVPGLIEYIAKLAPIVNDGSVRDVQVAAIGEVWKAFSALYGSTQEQHRKCSFPVVIGLC